MPLQSRESVFFCFDGAVLGMALTYPQSFTHVFDADMKWPMTDLVFGTNASRPVSFWLQGGCTFFPPLDPVFDLADGLRLFAHTPPSQASDLGGWPMGARLPADASSRGRVLFLEGVCVLLADPRSWTRIERRMAGRGCVFLYERITAESTKRTQRTPKRTQRTPNATCHLGAAPGHAT